MYSARRHISNEFVNFYKNIFTIEIPVGVEECLTSIEERDTVDMNTQLLKTLTEEEIASALTQMQPLKSLGSNGFAVCFCQKLWNTVGDEACQAVLGFLTTKYVKFGRINDFKI